jgi:hypothetical protein
VDAHPGRLAAAHSRRALAARRARVEGPVMPMLRSHFEQLQAEMTAVEGEYQRVLAERRAIDTLSAENKTRMDAFGKRAKELRVRLEAGQS